MKLDIKSIAILVLLGSSILFFAMWFFRGSDTKDKIKNLEEQNKNIEKVRDSLELANKTLIIGYDKIQKNVEERDSRIKEIENLLSNTKKDLNNANEKVKQNQKDLSETKKKIENLKNNPIKREDDELINSLKEKLK